jgi:hypothetical protein
MTELLPPLPMRPVVHKVGRYAALTTSTEPETNEGDLFEITIKAKRKGRNAMSRENFDQANADNFLINLVFKPNGGLKLRPAESQLLLAYIGEILKEVEDEEKVIVTEEKTTQGNREVTLCK